MAPLNTTAAERILAREIIRMDRRKPIDAFDEENNEAWPSSQACTLAVRILAIHENEKAAA